MFLIQAHCYFNKHFTTPSIDEYLLQLSVDDFMNHLSVSAIRNSAQKLDFSFEPVSIPCVTESLVNLNIRKSVGQMDYRPNCLSF